jgi:hypothetical protein
MARTKSFSYSQFCLGVLFHLAALLEHVAPTPPGGGLQHHHEFSIQIQIKISKISKSFSFALELSTSAREESS